MTTPRFRTRDPAGDDDDAATIIMNAPAYLEADDTVLEASGDSADLTHFAEIDQTTAARQLPDAAQAAPDRSRLILVVAVVITALVVIAATTKAVLRAHDRSAHVRLPASLFRPPPPRSHPTILFASPVARAAIPAPPVSEPNPSVPTVPPTERVGDGDPAAASRFGLADHQPQSSLRRSRRLHLDENGILIPSQ